MTNKKKGRQSARGIPSWLFLAVGALLIVVAAVGIWAILQTPSQTGNGIGPQLAVSQERIDLGKQPFNQMVQARFQVKNTGDRVLTLDASDPVQALQGC